MSDLEKAQNALARAAAKADEEFWSQSAKQKVAECRRALARAQKALEAQGQDGLPLGIEEDHQTPGAFR